MNRINERMHLPHWLNDQGLTGSGVEVGVFRGEFARHMLNHWWGQTYYMVDRWAPDPSYTDNGFGFNAMEWGDIYKQALAVAEQFPEKAKMRVGPSLEICAQCPDDSMDFVYLDGDHRLAAVTADLNAWWPKVKPGGLFGGHDFANIEFLDVTCAVQTWAKNNPEVQIVLDNEFSHCMSWWCVKP